METLSEKEDEYSEPLVKLCNCQVAPRVTLMNALSWTSHVIYFTVLSDIDLTLTTQTWSINCGVDIRDWKKMAVHGLRQPAAARGCANVALAYLPEKLCCVGSIERTVVQSITPLYILVYFNHLQ